MRLPLRPISYIFLSTLLVACGGGGGSDPNCTLLQGCGQPDPTPDPTNPTGPTTPGDGSGITTSNGDDVVSVKTQFMGFYIESPEYDRDDFSVGHMYIETYASPGALKGEPAEPFEGTVSYKYKDCQDSNNMTFFGRYNQLDQSFEVYNGGGTVDGATQTFFTDVTFNADILAWAGPYDINGSDYITTDCITHQLAARGKVELFPMNTTSYTDSAADRVVKFNSSNPRVISWNYENFTDLNASFEHITVSVFDKTKLDDLKLFDASNNPLDSSYIPRMPDDLFIWQQTIAGDATSFTVPDSVALKTDNYYILTITAWSSADLSNKVYFTSNHVFRAD